MQTKTKYLDIGGGAGALELRIPVYSIGSFTQPSLGITCSVHGDEHAGLFIASRFLDLIRDKNFEGTIHLIPAANPVAQFVNSRVSSLDQKDLNRTGRGRDTGTFTDRVASILFDELSHNCDFVINIHEFEMQTPNTAVFMNAGSEKIKAKTLQGIRAFEPEIIWVIEKSQGGDAQYLTTLDTALALADVPNFPIETAQLSLLTNENIEKAALGLVNVAEHLGIISLGQEKSSTWKPRPFIRQEVTAGARESGLWEPTKPFSLAETTILTDEVIGTIKRFPDFSIEEVHSPSSGTLVQCRKHQLVSTGTSLFSIGHDATPIILPYL